MCCVLWGKARTPHRGDRDRGGAREGQGRCAARLGQEGPSWDPLQARPYGDRGQGTSTRDTTTPRARRNKKTILTHRGDMFCADGIQAAARQGGVQTAAVRRWGTERHEKKEKQNKEISTHAESNSAPRVTEMLNTDRRPHPVPTQSRTPSTLHLWEKYF